MELPRRMLKQIAFNTRPKIEEHMLAVMVISTQEEHLSQPIQSIFKQLKTADSFSTGYNGIFYITNKKDKFYSTAQLMIMILMLLLFPGERTYSRA